MNFYNRIQFSQEELAGLYEANGWVEYTKNPEQLWQAFTVSLFTVCCRDAQGLAGVARLVGDGLSVILVQDLILRPDLQGQGFGRELLKQVLEPYTAVRQKLVVCDSDPALLSFYQKAGFQPLAGMDMTALMCV